MTVATFPATAASHDQLGNLSVIGVPRVYGVIEFTQQRLELGNQRGIPIDFAQRILEKPELPLRVVAGRNKLFACWLIVCHD